MFQKRENPTVIPLEKSSSGTREFRKPPKSHFKPWQRLWLVTGIVYLLILAGSFKLLMPDRENIERQMVLAVTEEVKRYDGMAFAGESPRNVFEIARSQGFSNWIAAIRSRYRIGLEGNAGFERIDKEYHEALTDLPMKQTIGLLFCALFWLVPMAALYAIGFVIDWVKRGTTDIRG